MQNENLSQGFGIVVIIYIAQKTVIVMHNRSAGQGLRLTSMRCLGLALRDWERAGRGEQRVLRGRRIWSSRLVFIHTPARFLHPESQETEGGWCGAEHFQTAAVILRNMVGKSSSKQ